MTDLNPRDFVAGHPRLATVLTTVASLSLLAVIVLAILPLVIFTRIVIAKKTKP